MDVPSPESPQQAVDDATRLCALQEWKDWGSLAKLASALNAAGRTVEARQRLQEALTLAPDNQRGALEQQLSEIE